MTHAINPTTNSYFLNLPIDVIPLILGGLDIQSLIRFEMVCKDHNSLAQHSWYYKREKEKFLFDWSFLDKHSQVNKWSYVLSSLLMDHINGISKSQVKDLSKEKQQIQIATVKKNQNQWISLINRFPLWGCYIEESLNELYSSSNYLILKKINQLGNGLINYFSPSKHKQALVEKAKEGKWGGDLLLQGLFAVKQLSPASQDKDIQQVIDYFKKAIDKKVPFLLSYSFIQGLIEAQVDRQYLVIMANAAAEQGDYMTAECVRHSIPPEYTNQLTFNKDLPFGKLKADLGYVALHQKQWKVADFHYQEALKVYGEGTPSTILKYAAYVKLQLGKLEEADVLYMRALAMYGEQASNELLINAKAVKFQLKQFKEADALCTQLLRRKGDQAEAGLWADTANIKLKLEQFEAADTFYTRALERYGDQAPAGVLVKAADVKWMLNQVKAADMLYTRALEKYEDQASYWTLTKAALVKLTLEQFEAADTLYTRALEKEGNQASARTWMNAAYIKFRLGQFEASDILFTRALEKYEGQINCEILSVAGYVKLKVKQFEAADSFFTRALKNPLFTCELGKGGHLVPSIMVSAAALVKFELQQFEAADALYTRALAEYGEQAPKEVLAQAQEVKTKILKKE